MANKFRSLTALAAALVIGLASPPAIARDGLPLLGDASSSTVSLEQEQLLGSLWLKMFRSRVETHQDPLLQDYLERLLFNLATYSELARADLTLLLIDNPSMNAFAVPGGVIGFHTGVFSYADNEDQLVTVLAHELAHLSLRHYARGVEKSQNQSKLNMAGLLAAVVLAATAGGDAATAALMTTQAATLQQQLAYSRSNEQEADREGIKTMQRSGRDATQVAAMFENMLKATRYTGSRPPEYLLTHPITERRIADALNRVGYQTPAGARRAERSDFALLRSRARAGSWRTPQLGLEAFRAEAENALAGSEEAQAAQYGVAYMELQLGNVSAARALIDSLRTARPNSFTLQYSALEIAMAESRFAEVITELEQLLEHQPLNYPAQMLLAQAHWQAGHNALAADLFEQLSRQRSEDPAVWYQLAEVRGLAGDIAGVHAARAEYFILIGVFDRAREQINLALGLLQSDFKRSAVLNQRLRDLAEYERRAERL